VAGPIVRASELLPQFVVPPRFADVRVRAALLLFLSGFVKKACIADRIAAVVDPVFATPAAYDAASMWIAAAIYHVQIYCDFSGYTDMAIATAALLGYRLPENFAFRIWRERARFLARLAHDADALVPRLCLRPARRQSRIVARDRAQPVRGVPALRPVARCGVTFVAWAPCTAPARGGARRIRTRARAVAATRGGPYVNGAVMLAWVLFAAPDFERARAFFAGLAGSQRRRPRRCGARRPAWALLLPPLAVAHLVAHDGFVPRVAARLPDWAFALAYGALAAAVLPWVATGILPFIYFQF